MERPKIKDKEVAKYVDYLEQKLEPFQADTTNVKLYLGVKRQLDDMANLLLQDIEVEDPNSGTKKTVKLMDVHALSSKDDKFIDRYFKVIDNFKSYMKDLKEAEELISPDMIEKVTKVEVGSIADKYAYDS